MWLDTSVPETTTNGPAARLEKGDSTMETFAVSVIAADEADASERVARRLPEGFGLTGRAAVTDAKHMLCSVEVANNGGDVNDAWVVLTSYGITPAGDLGSAWQAVAGIGKAA